MKKIVELSKIKPLLLRLDQVKEVILLVRLLENNQDQETIIKKILLAKMHQVILSSRDIKKSKVIFQDQDSMKLNNMTF